MAGFAACARAEPTTTEAVIEQGRFMVYDATCLDVHQALGAVGAGATAEQTLLAANVLAFLHGVAYARGITMHEAMDEYATRCGADGSQPFAGFPRPQ